MGTRNAASSPLDIKFTISQPLRNHEESPHRVDQKKERPSSGATTRKRSSSLSSKSSAKPSTLASPKGKPSSPKPSSKGTASPPSVVSSSPSISPKVQTPGSSLSSSPTVLASSSNADAPLAERSSSFSRPRTTEPQAGISKERDENEMKEGEFQDPEILEQDLLAGAEEIKKRLNSFDHLVNELKQKVFHIFRSFLASFFKAFNI